MLATFSSKCGQLFPGAPPSLLDLCSFSFFWPSWLPLGAIWARFGRLWGSILESLWARFWKVFGLDFGKFLVLFWKLLATIWAYDSSWKTCSFNPFCWRLVLDGLVGLREAQRISLSWTRPTLSDRPNNVTCPSLSVCNES